MRACNTIFSGFIELITKAFQFENYGKECLDGLQRKESKEREGSQLPHLYDGEVGL
jgi:hypothetical protein